MWCFTSWIQDFFFISLSEGKWCPLFPHPYTCRAWSFCEEGTPIGVTIATLINRTSVDVTWCYQILIKVLNIASSEGEGHNGGGWGVLTANILWKIPQRQHTGVDIGRGIEAEHVLMRAGKCHSCSFTLISHTHTCVSHCGPLVVGLLFRLPLVMFCLETVLLESHN